MALAWLPAMANAQILLVEDDADYRGLLDDYLQSLGHCVAPFASAEEALGHIERNGLGPRCLVVTDLRMAGRSGLELAAEVKRSHPGLPVVMMSAFGNRQLGSDARGAGVDAFLEKPFRLAELARVVEALLGPD